LQLLPDLGAGGTQRLAIEIVKRLSSEFRMVVCCLDDAGEWAGELTEYDVPVVPLHRPTGFHPSIGARIARLAAEHKATVLHSHHYSPFVYGRIASLLNRRLSHVFTEHGRLSDAPPTMKRRIANTMLSRFSGPVFAVSAALKRHMVAEGFPPAASASRSASSSAAKDGGRAPPARRCSALKTTIRQHRGPARPSKSPARRPNRGPVARPSKLTWSSVLAPSARP
jgi:hypothetical protein